MFNQFNYNYNQLQNKTKQKSLANCMYVLKFKTSSFTSEVKNDVCFGWEE